MDRFALYDNAFRAAGLRMTEQRRVICQWLSNTDLHPTPYQVYEGITATHPEISRATIYNTLNTLQQLGAIVEISMGADETHYDTDPSPHANLICLRCHKVIDFHLDHAMHEHDYEDHPINEDTPDLTAALGRQIKRATGFQTLSVRTDVLGVCADCTAGSSNSASPTLQE